ncbi:MAG: TonB-dependent receptor [bacterium]|jgi:iron complex outermembrane receptor protein|nr:TonB-dependent receptor [bacterium]
MSLFHSVQAGSLRGFRQGLGLAFLTLATALRALAGPDCAVLQGRVLDARDGQPLPLSHVFLLELGRGTATDAQGTFTFRHVPYGGHRVRVTHLGHRDHVQDLRLEGCDSLRLTIRLEPRALALAEIRVSGEAERLEQLHDPALMLRTAELQRELGSTLAETLDEQTGIATRSMGPAPARPVLRGHSGDRLLLLEDGAGTGDLSATSADHAVAMEPLVARQVVWIRGAETLLFSSGAAGGVLDVERGLLPGELPVKPEGTVALVAETASGSLGSSARLDGSWHQMGWMAGGSWRQAGDLRTPAGRLGNSGLGTGSLSTGIAHVGDRRRVGVGATLYESAYGIPGGFVGGHPEGVDIELARRNLHVEADLRPARGLRHVKLAGTFSHYEHAEFESSGLLGVSFDVLSAETGLELGLPAWGSFRQGQLRLAAHWRNFATGGLSHAPDTDERQLSLAWLEHALLPGGWHLQGALRGESRRLAPDRERMSLVVGHIRERSFHGLSAALQVDAPELSWGTWRLQPGGSLLRTWRPPTVEELFSGGPHLAAYSYEIGNPELGAERGWLLEAGAKARWSGLTLHLRGFHQEFQDYVFPSFTGRLSPRRADLFEYRTVGRDARHSGLELDAAWHDPRWRAQLGASLVRARLAKGGPLPAVPPATARLQAVRIWRAWEAGVQLSGALAQDQVYRAEDPEALPEARTAGWLRLDLLTGWRGVLGGRLHQMDVRVDNALDQEYRNHLSRLRGIMPEAGRSARLVWRMWF